MLYDVIVALVNPLPLLTLATSLLLVKRLFFFYLYIIVPGNSWC